MTTASSSTTRAAADEVRTATDANLGTILVDANGMTLYRNTKEASGTIACTGQCRTNWPPLLKGTGSTLTSYVYGASPAGEGNAPQKAYAAAIVLLLIVLALNSVVDLVARRSPAKERA